MTLPRSGSVLLGAGSSQDAGHTVIALVTAVLVHRMIRAAQWDHQTPRLGPRARVIDRHLVLQRAWSGLGEAFDDVQLLAGPAHEAAGFVVGRLDDEGVPLPMSPRVAKPLTNGRREMGTLIQGNHTSVV